MTPALFADAPVFPRKPIKIVVYMAPGGLIDATARRFAEIAQKYTSATFVIENSVGAGGIVAMKNVLAKPADGYTILACTKSNLSKIVSARCEDLLPQFHWTALLIRDPECVITLRDSVLSEWTSLVEDAKRKAGGQIWVGPAWGGLDHVMALKTWAKLGIEAKWIPYKSGGEAQTALLGKQGVAYVGNPRDASGNRQFRIAAISTVERLPQFPDVPTLRELGVNGLDSESMWRGFALKTGCGASVLDWYDDLFRKVTNDPNWRNTWQADGIDVVYLDEPKFRQVVDDDVKEFATYLSRLNIVSDQTGQKGSGIVTALMTIGAVLFIAVTSKCVGHRWSISTGQVAIPIALAMIAATILIQSIGFRDNETAGPGLIPKLLGGVIIVLSLQALLRTKRPIATSIETADGEPIFGSSVSSQVVSAMKMIVWVCAYLVAVHFMGYLTATGLFLCTSMYFLGVHQKSLISFVTISWLLVSHFIFVKLLFVPLPAGTLWQSIF